MKRISLLLLAVCFALLAASGCEKSAKSRQTSLMEPAAMEQARAHLAKLGELEQRALALCTLGRQSESLFPDLATQFYKDALKAVEAVGDPATSDLATELRTAVRKPILAQYKDSALALAQKLEKKARSAWLARLVAQGSAGLDPQLAQDAMQLGLYRAGSNPDEASRDWDLAGLVLEMSRWAPKSAMAAAQRVKSPWVRTWIWRSLAGQFKQPDLLELAARESTGIIKPARRAMVLALLAGESIGIGADGGEGLFQEALKQAAALPDTARIHFVQGECVAQLVGQTSAAQLKQVWKLDPGAGARFKALNLATKELLILQPARGKQLWQAALREALDLSLADERARAISSLVASMAALDPAEAARAWRAGPKGDLVLDSEAASALILVAAGRDLEEALAKAETIQDLSLRIGAMARMADILRRKKPKLARGVYVKILELASELGLDLVPPQILARAVVETDPQQAKRLSDQMTLPLRAAEYLYNLAKIFTKKNRPSEARKYLQICLTTVNSAVTKQILDKVRLLGDMGRGWVEIDEAQARRIFEQAAEITRSKG